MSDMITTRPILCRRAALLTGTGELAVGDASAIVNGANARVMLVRSKLGRVRRLDVWRNAEAAVVHEFHESDAGSGLVMPAAQVGLHIARVWSGMLGPLASGASDDSIEIDVGDMDDNGLIDIPGATVVNVSLDVDDTTVRRVVTVQLGGGTTSATLDGHEATGWATGVDSISAWAAIDGLLTEWAAFADGDRRQSFERSST